MATGSSIDELAQKLSGTHVHLEESAVVNYSGRALKLDKESDAEALVQDINKCSSLKCLQLSGNTVGPSAAKVIANALQGHPEFERALWSDMFTGRSKAEIPPALRELGGAVIGSGARLIELDLSDNAFGPVGVESIVDLLQSASCFSLKHLRLNNNGLGITGGKLLAKTLLQCHAASKQAGTPLALTVFVSGRNRLENEGATALAEAFKAIGTLEEVSMPQNGINHPGIAALADAFSVCSQLRSINLCDNTFTLKGAVAMAEALPKLHNLEVINFESCLVKTQGAKRIAAALKDGHSNLKELNLQYNEIGTEGAVAVVQSMKGKGATLQRLELNGNALGETGMENLRAAMRDAGLHDVLGSLSEDEGSEDEGDQGEDEHNEENADEEEEGHEHVSPNDDEDTSGEIIDDPGLQIRGHAVGMSRGNGRVSPWRLLHDNDVPAVAVAGARPSTVDIALWKRYMANQMARGQGAGDEAVPAKDIVSASELLDKATRFAMEVAIALSAYKDEEKEKAAAFVLCDAIFQAIPEGAVNAVLLANCLVVQLGLIKSEDKKFKPVTDNLTGPLILLTHAVRQPYIPKVTRDIIKVCLSQPHKRMEPYVNAKHQLLQALYKY